MIMMAAPSEGELATALGSSRTTPAIATQSVGDGVPASEILAQTGRPTEPQPKSDGVLTAGITATEIQSIFLSIIFAFFLTLWIESFERYVAASPDSKFAISYLNSMTYSSTSSSHWDVINAMVNVASFFTFLLLLAALWWWYGIFLPKQGKRTSFSHYLHDYGTLGAFGLGFRYWGTVDIFLLALCASGLLTGLRLVPIVRILKNAAQQAARDSGSGRRDLPSADPRHHLLTTITRLRLYLFLGPGGIVLLLVLVCAFFLGKASVVARSEPLWSADFVVGVQGVAVILVAVGVWWTWRVANVADSTT